MSEIERLSRALCRHYCAGHAEFCTDAECTDWENYTAEVRAILEAMLEPSAAMVDAGAKHENWRDYHTVRQIYAAMLNTILESK